MLRDWEGMCCHVERYEECIVTSCHLSYNHAGLSSLSLGHVIMSHNNPITPLPSPTSRPQTEHHFIEGRELMAIITGENRLLSSS